MHNKKIVINNFLIVYAIFIVICLISVIYAREQSVAFSKTITLVLLFIVMFSFINYIDSYDKIRKIIYYFIYSGIISCLYIIIDSDFTQITRFGSELGNVNTVGLMIAVSSLFCFYTILYEAKYMYIVFMFLMAAVVLLTGSRKALLFLALGIMMMLFYKNKNNIKGIIKFCIISLILMVSVYSAIFKIPIFYQIIGSRMKDLFAFFIGGTTDHSTMIRSYMAKFGFDLFEAKPLLGYGINNYRFYLQDEIGRQAYSHNNYIELAVGVGFLGLISYCSTHLVVLKELFLASKKNSVCFVFITIILLYMLLGGSFVYYDTKDISLLLAVASTISRVQHISN